MNKIVLTFYIIGLIAICSFATPVQSIYNNEIFFSHIFSPYGNIMIGRFMLYLLLLTIICLTLNYLLKES